MIPDIPTGAHVLRFLGLCESRQVNQTSSIHEARFRNLDTGKEYAWRWFGASHAGGAWVYRNLRQFTSVARCGDLVHVLVTSCLSPHGHPTKTPRWSSYDTPN